MMFIVAVLMLAFLIFVHELGHFTIARICGVKVEVFSIGFGKKLWFFKLFGTQFALSLIPLRGYVELKGMDKEEYGTNETADDSYVQKKPFPKAMDIVWLKLSACQLLGMRAIFY
ncbi:site-2 protease family protein [Helicobacter pylori]|nr:site-2 protease family protein [Helicobacter pylori]